jgi:hypothetical protein
MAAPSFSEPWFRKCRDHLLQRKGVSGFPQEASFRFGSFLPGARWRSVSIVAHEVKVRGTCLRVSGVD